MITVGIQPIHSSYYTVSLPYLLIIIAYIKESLFLLFHNQLIATSQDILQALYKEASCITKIPIELAFYHLDFFWSIDYIYGLLATYFSMAETILIRIVSPLVWNILEKNIVETKNHPIKTDHDLDIAKRKYIKTSIKSWTVDNLDMSQLKESLLPKLEKDLEVLIAYIKTFQLEFPLFTHVKRKLFEIYLSSPQLITNQSNKIITFVNQTISTFTSLLNYLFIPENASISIIEFYKKVYNICKNSQTYYLREYNTLHNTIKIPQKNMFSTLLGITAEDIYGLLSPAVYSSPSPFTKKQKGNPAESNKTIAYDFETLFTEAMKYTYTRNNDEIVVHYSSQL